MKRSPQGGRIALLALLLTLGLAGCVSNDEAAAAAKAEAYLAAVGGGAADRGWSFLLPGERDSVFADEKTYRAQAESSDWDDFTWEVVEAQCDDGACTVWLAIPQAEALPAVLTEGAIRYRNDGVPAGANASLVVLQRGLLGDGVSLSQG